MLVRRTLAASVAACLLLAGPAYPLGHVAPAVVPPVEIIISGPHLIRRGEILKFKVTVTNRSDKPIALRFPFLYDDETRLVWNITNTSGRLLPPYSYDGPPIFVCPVTGPVNDMMIS